MMSSGNSMCTGRGRAELNTANARAITSFNSSARNTVWLNAATPLTNCC